MTRSDLWPNGCHVCFVLDPQNCDEHRHTLNHAALSAMMRDAIRDALCTTIREVIREELATLVGEVQLENQELDED